MNDSEAYEQVAAEIAAGKLEPGLWARAFSDAMGLQDQARALYIKLRVAELLEVADERKRQDHEAERESPWRQLGLGLLITAAIAVAMTLAAKFAG